ncbi:MAG: hypothetical protein Q9160_008758 [Pyrenula sp. 1 TL-2023]
MFFIAPDIPKPPELLIAPVPTDVSSTREKRKHDEAFDTPQSVDNYYPKRNQRACDRCRLRKAKCSGGRCCEKCKRDGVICTTNRSTKSDQKAPSVAYVQMVESQRDFLIQALGKLSKLQKPSRADVEKIIHDVHTPTREDLGNPADPREEKSMVTNDTAETLGQQSAYMPDLVTYPEEPSQDFDELYQGLSEMEDWSTLLNDAWNSFPNMLETNTNHAT